MTILRGKNMNIKDIRVGEKFVCNNNTYLRIDMNPSAMFLNRNYDGIVCALDLKTYKVMCLMTTEIVEHIKE